MISEQLKKSILQAAIQGKLTQQLPEDGDARDLLKEIRKEKAQLIKEGKIKKEKPLHEITEDEIPFEIPENWCWVRLGEIGETNIGLTYAPSDVSESGTLVLRSGNIENNKVVYFDNVYVSCKIQENKLCRIGDILICARNGSKKLVGKAAIIDQEGMSFGAFMALYRSPFNQYIHKYLSSSYFRADFDGVNTTTINQITQNNLKERLLPLPPRAEQQRIVERLEELLPEIENLKNDEARLEELQKSFPKKMKDAILQYAIQGKLTQQLPEDGDAKDLLKEIQTEKEKLIKEGKINKEKSLPKITEDEIPFEIPENWCWVRFGNLVNFRIGKTPQRNNGRFWGQDYHWVSIADMKPDGLISETKEKISGIALNEVFKKTLVPAGTLLMSFKLTIGRVSILDINAVHNEAIISILPYKNEENIARNYYFKILPLISTTGNFKSAIKGKTLNSTSINNLLIPLPPLAEQKRIVKRIEELLPLCEELQ